MNNRRRISKVICDFIDEKGVSELEKLVGLQEKLENQSENLRKLQAAELKDRRDADEIRKKAMELFDSINADLVKSRFFDEFYNSGIQIIKALEGTNAMNPTWIMTRKEELKKLCRR